MCFYKWQAAELLVRTITGILFLFQGYDKLFKVKIGGVIDAFTADAERRRIPHAMVSMMAYFTSTVEFIGGIMLLLGFCTTYTLYALGLDLILVTFAFSYMQPIWDMKFVFPRLVLVIALLLLPENGCLFRLDAFLHIR